MSYPGWTLLSHFLSTLSPSVVLCNSLCLLWKEGSLIRVRAVSIKKPTGAISAPEAIFIPKLPPFKVYTREITNVRNSWTWGWVLSPVLREPILLPEAWEESGWWRRFQPWHHSSWFLSKGTCATPNLETTCPKNMRIIIYVSKSWKNEKAIQEGPHWVWQLRQ